MTYRKRFKTGDQVRPRFVNQFPSVPYESIGKVIERSKARGCMDRVLVEFAGVQVWESEEYLERAFQTIVDQPYQDNSRISEELRYCKPII